MTFPRRSVESVGCGGARETQHAARDDTPRDLGREVTQSRISAIDPARPPDPLAGPRTRCRAPRAAGRAEGVARAEEEAAAREARDAIERHRTACRTPPQSGTRPPNRNAEPPPAAPSRSAHTAARIAASVTSVSASTKTSIAPVAARAPALRVAAIWRCSTRTTRAPCARAIAPVRSVDASSTTIVSNGTPSGRAAASIAQSVAPSRSSSSCAGTMKEIISLHTLRPATGRRRVTGARRRP